MELGAGLEGSLRTAAGALSDSQSLGLQGLRPSAEDMGVSQVVMGDPQVTMVVSRPGHGHPSLG